jgi:vacuolar-type H+-ATPase subunit E/Vma4
MSGRRLIRAGQRAGAPRRPAVPEDSVSVVHAALDHLADEITVDCMAAVNTELERVGLSADLTNADKLRGAVRNVVIENLFDELRERVAEIEAEPQVVARLKVSTTREVLIEFLTEYAR